MQFTDGFTDKFDIKAGTVQI